MLKYNFILGGSGPYGIAPEVAHPGEDIGYDLYSPYTVLIRPHSTVHVPTGLAIEFDPSAGAIIRERSSLAKHEIIAIGGVIDAGYRGELIVMLHNLGQQEYELGQGCKFVQLIEMPKLATIPERVISLSASLRDVRGFGSSGR